MTQFRYWRRVTKEIKGTSYDPEKPETLFLYDSLAKLSERFAVNCTAIFLRKGDFTGPYLREDSWKGPNALWFRNWVIRQLLETHFRFNRAFSNTLEVVFDRYDLSEEQQTNLEKYVANNYYLPDIAYFTHADSLYVDFLQVTDLLQDPFLTIARGKGSDELRKALGFVSAWDYTQRDKPSK